MNRDRSVVELTFCGTSCEDRWLAAWRALHESPIEQAAA
jgi:hypothetical protein